jgi:serine/threonine-protein kinase RsbW
MSRANEWQLVHSVSPDLPAVDRVCTDVRNRLKESVTDADSFAVELLVREALVNAVTHGCRERPGGQISCQVRRQGRDVWVSVSDDGSGFDWRAQRQTTVADLATSGRGVALYALYANRVSFNEAGNEVVLYRRLSEPAEEIEHDGTSHQP